MFTTILSRMLVLFSMMAVGYMVGKTKVLSLEDNKTLSKLVNYVTNPCSILYAALCSERTLGNVEILQLLGIAALMFGFLMLVAQPIPSLLRVPKGNRGLYQFMVIFSNIGYMGIPVVTAILGPSVTVGVAVFIMVFYVFIYSYGVFLLQDKKGSFQFKSMLTPMMVSSLVSILCYLCNVRLTGIPAEVLGSLRNLTTPCAMLIIGCALSSLPVASLFTNWRLYIMALLKLLVIPGAVYLCLSPLLGSSTLFKMLIVMMAMPVASNFIMLCAIYDREQQLPATAVFITTALSVLTIPVIAWLLTI